MLWWSFVILVYILLGFRAWLWILLPIRAIRRRRALWDKPSTEIAIPDEPVYETYGHPWAPIPELVAKLPRPPVNYSWEITALLNGHGSPALRLSLLDLRTSEIGDFIERDLVVIRRWRYAEDDTFASFYRRAADGRGDAQTMCRKVFYAHLLAPMADWAAATVACKAVTDPPALVSNYKLVQAA